MGRGRTWRRIGKYTKEFTKSVTGQGIAEGAKDWITNKPLQEATEAQKKIAEQQRKDLELKEKQEAAEQEWQSDQEKLSSSIMQTQNEDQAEGMIDFSSLLDSNTDSDSSDDDEEDALKKLIKRRS